ncbi:MAG: magnesium transporter [Myxococcota bacterium]
MNELELKAYFASLPHPADITEYLEQTDLSEWPKLLRLIEDREIRAEVVAEIDEAKWRDLLSRLQPPEIAEIIGEMESDDAADIIAKLPLPLRYETLYRLPDPKRHQVLVLLGYPEDSAGGIMQVELARVQENALVSDAIIKVRELVEEDVPVLAVWVVDKEDRLMGTIELADLLIHKSTLGIRALMKPDVICVRPLVDQKEVAQLFKKYDLLTLPVVDDENHLIGRISIDDIVDVLTEEAEEDALRMAGTSAEELIYPEQVFSTARIRLPWLAVALVCSLISASLLKLFEPLLHQMTVIYAFLPVIMAMGGNVGTQSSTILIRGLATGKSDLSDIPRALFKEIRVGLVMGIFYGFCAGFVTTFLLSDNNYALGGIVLTSMVIAMITAAALGVLAPALLRRLNIDPAIAAGPFVTTLNDITGILIYMCTAQAFRGLLI